MLDIKRKLLSIATVIDQDLKVHFDKNGGTKIVELQGKVVGRETQCNNIYKFLRPTWQSLPLQLIHMDLYEKMEMEALGSAYYFMMIKLLNSSRNGM